MAYFECLHEVKLIVDLVYEGGEAFNVVTPGTKQTRNSCQDTELVFYQSGNNVLHAGPKSGGKDPLLSFLLLGLLLGWSTLSGPFHFRWVF